MSSLLSSGFVLCLFLVLNRTHLFAVLKIILFLLFQGILDLVIVDGDGEVSFIEVVIGHLLHVKLFLEDLFGQIGSLLLILEEHFDSLSVSLYVFLEAHLRPPLVLVGHHLQTSRAQLGDCV